MKFSSFMSILAFLVVVPSIADAVTCGEVTCKSSGTWVYVGSGIEVQSLGYCITVNGGQYCAASAARCRAGYFAGLPVCESVTLKAGYAPRCPSDTGGASCFGLSCTKCSSYTGVSNATSDAGTAENSCGCYIGVLAINEGTNGEFRYSSDCYYTDSADCATTRSALVKVYSPVQNVRCPEY